MNYKELVSWGQGWGGKWMSRGSARKEVRLRTWDVEDPGEWGF